MKIFGDTGSGNCMKIKYVADHLRLPYEWVQVSSNSGETRSPAFLARNPMGQVPVVELADGRHLAQSNAIIRYLARSAWVQTHGSDPETRARSLSLLPDDPFTQAKIDEWLFWEQYSHEPYVAVCRFHMLYQGKPKEQREAWRVERGEKALDLMEAHLAGTADTGGGRAHLVGDGLTIADVSLLAYTRVADEGGFDLGARPHIRKWIARCETELGLPT